MRRVPLLLVLAVLSAIPTGCVATNFRPYSAAQGELEKVTDAAVQIFEGDLALLQKLDARIVGSMSAQGGTAHKEKDLAHATGIKAAEVGATHFLLGEIRSERVQGPSTAYTTCNGSSCWTTFQPGAQGYRASATYTLFRLEKARWSELPPPLRPYALGKAPLPEKQVPPHQMYRKK